MLVQGSRQPQRAKQEGANLGRLSLPFAVHRHCDHADHARDYSVKNQESLRGQPSSWQERKRRAKKEMEKKKMKKKKTISEAFWGPYFRLELKQ